MLESPVECKGGLAYQVEFDDNTDRSDKLKVRQDSVPKKERRISNAAIKRKMIEADIRRQKQQLDTIVKLQETHETITVKLDLTSEIKEQKRLEIKKAHDEAMERAEKQRQDLLEEKIQKAKVKEVSERLAALEEEKKLGCKQAHDEAMERAEKQRKDLLEEKIQKAKVKEVSERLAAIEEEKKLGCKQAHDEAMERAQKKRLSHLEEKVQKAKVKEVSEHLALQLEEKKLETKQAQEVAMEKAITRRDAFLEATKNKAKMCEKMKRVSQNEDLSPTKRRLCNTLSL